MKAKSVEVLGYPVGNLWDIFGDSGALLGRVTYRVNQLVWVEKSPLVTLLTRDVEEAIDKLYPDPPRSEENDD